MYCGPYPILYCSYGPLYFWDMLVSCHYTHAYGLKVCFYALKLSICLYLADDKVPAVVHLYYFLGVFQKVLFGSGRKGVAVRNLIYREIVCKNGSPWM